MAAVRYACIFLLLAVPLSGCVQEGPEPPVETADQAPLDEKIVLEDEALLIRVIANETLHFEKWVDNRPEEPYRSSVSAVGGGRWLNARLDGFWQIRVQDQSIDLPQLLVSSGPISWVDEFRRGEHLLMLESFGVATQFTLTSKSATLEVVDRGPGLTTMETSWANDWETSIDIFTLGGGHYAGSARITVEHEAETLVLISGERWTLTTNHCDREATIRGIADRVYDTTHGDFEMDVEVTFVNGLPLVLVHTLQLPPGTVEPGCRTYFS